MNSRLRVMLLFLAVIAMALFAGKTMYVGQRDHVVRYYELVDGGVGAFTGPCQPGSYNALNAPVTRCFPDAGLNGFQLTGVGFVVSEALAAAGENCRIQTGTSDDGTEIATPQWVSSANFFIGPSVNNANFANNCPNFVNAIGESCYIALDTGDPNTWIEPGGWITLGVSAGAVGACNAIEGGTFWVDGYFP